MPKGIARCATSETRQLPTDSADWCHRPPTSGAHPPTWSTPLSYISTNAYYRLSRVLAHLLGSAQQLRTNKLWLKLAPAAVPLPTIRSSIDPIAANFAQGSASLTSYTDPHAVHLVARSTHTVGESRRPCRADEFTPGIVWTVANSLSLPRDGILGTASPPQSTVAIVQRSWH